MRVLVAGGAGFVGSNLCRKLIRRGDAVDCLDNLSTGQPEQVELLGKHRRFTFLDRDVADPAIVAELSGQAYDEIYHLACPTGVPNIATMGEEMMLASSSGTRNLLKLAERSAARFLFASSAEAYGDPEMFPQAEAYFGNVDPVGARSPYEEGKRFGEALTAYYARRHGVDGRIVRIFNCYGPNMAASDQRVIPQMLNRMAAGEPVVIYGDGRQTRALIHVDDLLTGFEAVMAKGDRGGVYNIGGDREITILELFELAATAAGSKRGPVFADHFITDHGRRLPDTNKVRQLGWRQRISIERGLADAYRDVLAARARRAPRPAVKNENAVEAIYSRA